jgi:hypothetical protein
MPYLSGQSYVTGLDLYTSQVATTQRYGQYQENGFGEGFRYVSVGASNLVIGNVIQGIATDTSMTGLSVPTALTVGQTGAIVITNGSATITAGQLAGGSLSVYTAGTVAIGDTYTIVSNDAATNASAMNLYLDRPLRYAFTTAAKVNIRYNQFTGVIQSPATTLSGPIIGAAIYPLTALQEGWIQSRGVTGVLGDSSAIIIGSAVGAPGGTAGACTLGTGAIPTIGYALQATLSGHAIAVNLQLA